MTGTYIACGVLAVLTLVAFVRVITRQRRTAIAKARLRDYEKRVKDAATEVSVVGTMLGPGARDLHSVNLTSAGFELRHADGSVIPVATGVRVVLFATDARIHAGAVTVPEGKKLLFLPPEIPVDDSPYKTAGGVAYTRGDELMLFDRDAKLFMTPDRQRTTSVLGLSLLLAIPAATGVLCVIYGPNTRWNVLMFLQVVALAVDLLAKGMLSWMACTRPPPPLQGNP